MHRPRLRSLIAALLALLLVLTACGDADTDDAPDEEEEQALALDLDEAPADEATEDEPPADEATDDEAEDVEETEFDLVAAADAYVSTIPEGWMFIREADEFADALAVDGAVVIDVREETEFAEGHIPGAINLPIRTVTQNLELVPVDRPVWIYCLSGWRAGLVVSSLRMIGYDNVSAYSPGTTGWEAAGNELVSEENQAEDFGDPGFEPAMVAAVDDFLATLPEGFLTNSLDEVQAAVDAGATLVDVREPDEYDEGFIPDALSVPLRSIMSTDVDIPQDSPVIVYCQSGYRAALALPVLHVTGWTNTEGFPGSFGAWVEAGEAVMS